jgi:hypothetical protein
VLQASSEIFAKRPSFLLMSRRLPENYDHWRLGLQKV